MKFKVTIIFVCLLIPSMDIYADLNDGLLGYWSFNDDTATDNSGNGNNGTIYGATPVSGVSGGSFEL